MLQQIYLIISMLKISFEDYTDCLEDVDVKSTAEELNSISDFILKLIVLIKSGVKGWFKYTKVNEETTKVHLDI